MRGYNRKRLTLNKLYIFKIQIEILEKRNYSCSSLASVCLYIRDMADYVRINEIYGRYFGLNPPVRVCVQSPIQSYALIEAVAFLNPPQKRVMHIQSISHWAPANIGPYSQCVEVTFTKMIYL